MVKPDTQPASKFYHDEQNFRVANFERKDIGDGDWSVRHASVRLRTISGSGGTAAFAI